MFGGVVLRPALDPGTTPSGSYRGRGGGEEEIEASLGSVRPARDRIIYRRTFC
jgi:hypothetical protein